MPDPDAVRRLLEGEIDPSEIDGDPELYSMAERIYGSEALEELGVLGPQIGIETQDLGVGLIPSDVTLPDFNPDIPETKGLDEMGGGRRRWGLFFVGILGMAGVVFNMVIGAGEVLCSVGIAEWRMICNEDYGQTKFVWTNGYSPDRLYEVETWVKPMGDPLLGDLMLITIFSLLAIFGIFSKKK